MNSNSEIAVTEAAERPIGVSWSDLPFLSIRRAAQLLCCSTAKIYLHLKQGELSAVRLDHKTLVRTPSIMALLETAEPWSPNWRIVAKANSARREQRKAEQEATSNQKIRRSP